MSISVFFIFTQSRRDELDQLKQGHQQTKVPSEMPLLDTSKSGVSTRNQTQQQKVRDTSVDGLVNPNSSSFSCIPPMKRTRKDLPVSSSTYTIQTHTCRIAVWPCREEE